MDNVNIEELAREYGLTLEQVVKAVKYEKKRREMSERAVTIAKVKKIVATEMLKSLGKWNDYCKKVEERCRDWGVEIDGTRLKSV